MYNSLGFWPQKRAVLQVLGFIIIWYDVGFSIITVYIVLYFLGERRHEL